MKKLFAAILAVAMLSLTSISAVAATTPYICPNGNAACVQSGACLADGTCVNHDACSTNGVCQYPEGCPNGGIPKHDGTGNQKGGLGGGHHAGGNGTGHRGGGRHH